MYYITYEQGMQAAEETILNTLLNKLLNKLHAT